MAEPAPENCFLTPAPKCDSQSASSCPPVQPKSQPQPTLHSAQSSLDNNSNPQPQIGSSSAPPILSTDVEHLQQNAEEDIHVEQMIPGWIGSAPSTAELARRAREGIQRGIDITDGESGDSDNTLIAPRILVLGPAGWGKSTIINNMFGDHLTTAIAGGAPVTSDFVEFGPAPNAPVRLVDSRGLERHSRDSQIDFIIHFVRTRDTLPLSDRVHAAWFVVGERWQPADTRLLRALRTMIQVIVVISKCDLPERNNIDERSGLPAKITLRDEVVKQFDDIDVIFCADPRKRATDWEPLKCKNGHPKDFFTVNNRNRIWTCEYDVGEGRLCGQQGQADDKLVGYAKLSQVTLYKLPPKVMPAFVHAQRANRELKDMRAVPIIRTGVLAMMGVAATPLPFPDLPVLLAVEGYMSIQLFLLYNVPADFANVALFSSINAAVIGSMGIAAKVIAKLLKASGAGVPLGIAVDVIVATVAGTIIGIGIAKVCSNWMFFNADEHHDFESFHSMLLDAIASINVGMLVQAIFRLLVFKDDSAITDVIRSDITERPRRRSEA